MLKYSMEVLLESLKLCQCDNINVKNLIEYQIKQSFIMSASTSNYLLYLELYLSDV